MNISNTLRRWLDHGTRPNSQRECSAILDETRGLLISHLPSTGEIMNTFTAAELDSINPKGGNVLDQMHAAYLKKQNFTPSNTPSTMQLFTKTSHPIAKKTATPATRPAPAPVASAKPAVNRATTKPAAAPVAPSPKLTSAAEFATPVLTMTRKEFDLLTPEDKMRFFKTGGKLAQ